jgi:hypothetical protein
MPATQILERGSSVTHNSLVASQRPHISLIDRRHSDDAALPMRFYVKQKRCRFEAGDVVRPLTALSHINVRVLPRRMQSAASGLELWPMAYGI